MKINPAVLDLCLNMKAAAGSFPGFFCQKGGLLFKCKEMESLLGLCGGGGSPLETNWSPYAQQRFPGPCWPFWENKGSVHQPE